MGTIIVSSVLLALENPLKDPKSTFMIVLQYADNVITLIFTMEMILKVITYGLIFNGKGSYLRNFWNIADCLIVLSSLVLLFVTE